MKVYVVTCRELGILGGYDFTVDSVWNSAEPASLRARQLEEKYRDKMTWKGAHVLEREMKTEPVQSPCFIDSVHITAAEVDDARKMVVDHFKSRLIEKAEELISKGMNQVNHGVYGKKFTICLVAMDNPSLFDKEVDKQ